MVSMIIVVASLFSGLLFLFSAWVTRAGYWRTAAALLGGLAAAGFRFGVDMIAYRFDWWTFGDTPYAPVVTYAPVMFWFGAGLGLIGWRMIRNWGAAGELSFFAAFVALGLGRDYCFTTMKLNDSETMLRDYSRCFGIHQMRTVGQVTCVLTLMCYSITFGLDSLHNDATMLDSNSIKTPTP